MVISGSTLCSLRLGYSGRSGPERWDLSTVLALPKHGSQEQDWLVVGGSRSCSALLLLPLPHSMLALRLDSQGFWAWGVR